MKSPSRPPSMSAPGPFRADQIREGDPYELSNGHPILCMGAGDRHGHGNLAGGQVLATDPAGTPAGVDVGFEFNQGKNLRAPDISVGNLTREPGWAHGVPLLAVEYADRGQDEEQLQQKIAELLAAGTRFAWVVRLSGPLRVEVYEPGQPLRTVDGEGVLTAPGILQNPVPVRALVDPEASNEATLRNLLNRKGYGSLEAVRESGQCAEARQAILTVLSARGLAVSDEVRARVAACADLPTLGRWLARAAVLPDALEAVAG